MRTIIFLDHAVVRATFGDAFVTIVMGVITDRCVHFKSTTCGYIRLKQVLFMRSRDLWKFCEKCANLSVLLVLSAIYRGIKKFQNSHGYWDNKTTARFPCTARFAIIREIVNTHTVRLLIHVQRQPTFFFPALLSAVTVDLPRSCLARTGIA